MQARRSTIVIAIALAAGAMIGFLGSSMLYHHWLRPAGESPFEQMSRSLALSDLQRSQMRAGLEATRQELNQARQDYEATQRQLMIKAYLHSRALLNPEQQARFDREFVPPELLQAARAANRQEAAASPAAVPAAAPTATPSVLPHGLVTSRSGA